MSDSIPIPHSSPTPPYRWPGQPGVWSVGNPEKPESYDRVFDTELEARNYAKTRSASQVHAIWDGPRASALYWEGVFWRSE